MRNWLMPRRGVTTFSAVTLFIFLDRDFLEDVDLPTLRELVKQSVDHVTKTNYLQ